MPAETVTHGYIPTFDLPSTLSSGLASYSQPTTYTAFSQVAQEEIGSSTKNAYVTNTYDPHSGMLTESKVANTAVTATPYDDTSYAYDPSGNITSEQDVRNNSATELQCFGYDLLQRLTQAWTTDGTHPCTAGPSDRKRRNRGRRDNRRGVLVVLDLQPARGRTDPDPALGERRDQHRRDLCLQRQRQEPARHLDLRRHHRARARAPRPTVTTPTGTPWPGTCRPGTRPWPGTTTASSSPTRPRRGRRATSTTPKGTSCCRRILARRPCSSSASSWS